MKRVKTKVNTPKYLFALFGTDIDKNIKVKYNEFG